MTFGNRSIVIHLAKGIGGFAALALALGTMNVSLLPSLVLLPLSLYLLRGCPTCWTIGLFETIAMRVHAKHAQACDSNRTPATEAGISLLRSNRAR